MDEMNGYNGYSGYGGTADYWGQPVPAPRDPEEEVRTARKHFSKLGLMFLCGTIVIYAVQIAAILIVRLLKPEWLWNADISLMISVLPMYLVGMPILILLVKQVPASKVEKRPMKAGSFIIAVIMCIGSAYVANILGNIMTWIIGTLKGSAVANEIANVAASVNIWLVVFYMVLCAPFMEEYVFRKLIVDRTVRYGQGVAVVMSGLMFGLFHGNLNQFVYAFTIGMFLAFLYVKTGKLKITIAIHMIFNFIGGVVTTLLTDMIDLDEYIRVALGGMETESFWAYLSEHMLGWILYFLFLFMLVGFIITSIVLFIVFLVKKKFTFARGEVALPRGRRFSTVILNAGMILYCIFWIGVILWQLFGDQVVELLG